MIECKTYSKDELLKALGVTSYVWEKRKKDFLEHLKDFCDQEMCGECGKRLTFTVKEVYAEYEALPRKSNKKEKEQSYEKFTLNQLEEHPINSVANVARNAVKDKTLHEKYHHKQSAAENYIRPVMKSDKVSKGEKVWVQLKNNVYEPITNEQMTFLKSLFNKYNSHAEVFSDVETGDLTLDQAKEIIFNAAYADYQSVMNAFIEKFGFRPIKAAKQEINFAIATLKQN